MITHAYSSNIIIDKIKIDKGERLEPECGEERSGDVATVQACEAGRRTSRQRCRRVGEAAGRCIERPERLAVL